MTRYRWSSQDGTRYDWEEVEKMTPSERMTHFSQRFGGKVDFTREGIEQLQEDVITFLDQFDEMPQGLVDEICQTIITYYNKHRPSAPSTLLNPSGDHKTI
jgi:hypothetical protein